MRRKKRKCGSLIDSWRLLMCCRKHILGVMLAELAQAGQRITPKCRIFAGIHDRRTFDNLNTIN